MKVFTEEQKFTQIWLHILLFVEIAIAFYLLFNNWSNNSKNNYSLIIALCIVFIVHLLIYHINLTTKIDNNGITFRFIPFLASRTIQWNEIEKAYVRTYNPILEYGGWGIRYTFGSKGKAYNIKGDKGVQIVLKNGKKILIGTQKPNEAELTLKNYTKND